MSGRLDGKVALVSGAASGFGAASARRFAREGAAVVLADILPDRGMESLEAIVGEGGRAVFVELDQADEAACEDAVARAAKEFGHVDALLAAGGILYAGYVSGADAAPPGAGQSLIHGPLEAFDKVLDVNLTGVMHLNRCAARQMIQQGTGGSIINVSSSGARWITGGSAYCVSKAGVEMLTRVLAEELGAQRIRVNCIAPGYMDTPMMQWAEDGPLAKAILDETPLGRNAQPEELANLALFLASDEASFVSGKVYGADGGFFTGS